MRHHSSKTKYSIGELVDEAYKRAGRVTHNRRVAAILASQTLESWLAKSSRPDLIRQLQSTES
jgi:hypothetical protein